MKKVQLDFQKKVISTLSGNDLSQLQGGNTAFSYNSCPTVDGPCTATNACTDQDSWQGNCLSDNKNNGGPLQHYLKPLPVSGDSCNYCYTYECLSDNQCDKIKILTDL